MRIQPSGGTQGEQVLDRHQGDVLFRAGDLEGARVSYGNSIARNPEDGTAHEALGDIDLIEGDFDKSVWHYRRAIAMGNASANLFSNLGNALIG